MPGLNLNMRVGAAAGGASAGGAVPVAAGQPSFGQTATQAAFGIGTSQTSGPATAGNGLMIAGAAAGLGLLWLWWTLPR